ncbi:hypothetical protein C8J57DRAFT_1723573 [Mycena rebaudengoi]|nr:hypothetical protein C8J57DRAFT_1723573 [Mycena rebaudengoi]
MGKDQVLRDRLAELDALIPMLQAERKKIHKTLDAIKYPVLELPTEVTAEIFIHCLPVLQHPFCGDPHYIRINAPRLLLQICRAWRDIALTTPKLWASFHIQGYYLRSTSWGQMFEEWVRRAGSSPLSMVLQHDDSAVEWSLFPGVFHQIIARPSQWRDVELIVPHRALLRPEFQTALQGKLHALERLVINTDRSYFHGHNMGVPTVEAIPLTAFETAPKLRAVGLLNFSLSFINLPWNQLTSFVGEKLSLSDCTRILGMTPLLVDCILTDVNNDDATNITTPPPLLHLKSLVLDGEPAGWRTFTQGGILGFLTLPALTQLHLPVVFADTFLPFLTRSRPSALRKLVLHTGYRCLIQGAASMPALSDVTINQPSLDQAAGILASLLASSAFIPNLESLCFTIVTPPQLQIEEHADIFAVGYETLVGALSRRWNAGGSSTSVRLSKFNLTWLENEQDSPIDRVFDEDIGIHPAPNVLERLSDLMDDGMDIYLGTLKKSWLISRP